MKFQILLRSVAQLFWRCPATMPIKMMLMKIYWSMKKMEIGNKVSFTYLKEVEIENRNGVTSVLSNCKSFILFS